MRIGRYIWHPEVLARNIAKAAIPVLQVAALGGAFLWLWMIPLFM